MLLPGRLSGNDLVLLHGGQGRLLEDYENLDAENPVFDDASSDDATEAAVREDVEGFQTLEEQINNAEGRGDEEFLGK